MSEIWKLEAAGPQEIGEGLSVKTPGNAKCKRLVKTVIATICLMLTCLAAGAIPAAEAGCRRKARTRHYVVERPVVIQEDCIRPRPVVVRTQPQYVPYDRKLIRGATYYAPRCNVIHSRPVYVAAWEDAPCDKRVVYREPDCDRRVVYREPDCDKRVVYREPEYDSRVVYEEPEYDRRVVYEDAMDGRESGDGGSDRDVEAPRGSGRGRGPRGPGRPKGPGGRFEKIMPR